MPPVLIWQLTDASVLTTIKRIAEDDLATRCEMLSNDSPGTLVRHNCLQPSMAISTSELLRTTRASIPPLRSQDGRTSRAAGADASSSSADARQTSSTLARTSSSPSCGAASARAHRAAGASCELGRLLLSGRDATCACRAAPGAAAQSGRRAEGCSRRCEGGARFNTS